MKTSGFRGFIFKTILLILLCLYFLLVFSQTSTNSSASFGQNRDMNFNKSNFPDSSSLPKLLSFEGTASKKQVRLSWKFETTEGLDECILERADDEGEFKPVAYFLMTEDIHLPGLRYTDTVPKSTTYYYRLKLSGKEGDQKYTKTLSFDFSEKQEQKRSLSYPLMD
jgi:hypothetical protein